MDKIPLCDSCKFAIEVDNPHYKHICNKRCAGEYAKDEDGRAVRIGGCPSYEKRTERSG